MGEGSMKSELQLEILERAARNVRRIGFYFRRKKRRSSGEGAHLDSRMSSREHGFIREAGLTWRVRYALTSVGRRKMHPSRTALDAGGGKKKTMRFSLLPVPGCASCEYSRLKEERPINIRELPKFSR